MSRRECPTVGADLLAAVSAALAVVKSHLTHDDPKVSLRAVSELTKLLAVCARNGIELREGEAGPASPSQEPSVPSAGGGDDYAAQLNQPLVPAPPTPSPVRRPPTVAPPARQDSKPRFTSFLGRADPVSQPQRPTARPLALPD